MTGKFLTAILLSASAAAAAAPAQKTFGTPEAAAQALIAAADPYDLAALKELLGPNGADLVVTGDTVQDKNTASAFAALAKEKTEVVRDPDDAGRATLIVGKDSWPSPIPIVSKKGAWMFDTKAGRKEILYRRVGRNELDAIEVCRGYVEAQHAYAEKPRAGMQVNQYAQRIISTPGTQDGLTWKGSDGTWEGPVAESIAKAIAEGYSSKAQPYHGYYFKVLKGQGPSAPLGTLDYVIQGAMIGGFALAAAPSDYAVTGVKSFIVSQDGVVYERDFGKKTSQWFATVDRFDPDKKWDPVDDDEDEDDESDD